MNAKDASIVHRPDLLTTRWTRRGFGSMAVGGLVTLGLGAEAAAKKGGKRKKRRGSDTQGSQLAFRFVTAWGEKGSGNGQFRNPRGLTITVAGDGAGDVFVADTGNNRVQRFTNNGVFLTAWGSRGGGNGQFRNPVSIAVDAAGFVYVADSGNARIQKFTTDGEFVLAWGSRGTGAGQFNLPSAITDTTFDTTATVGVTDAQNGNVQLFRGDGTFVMAFGSRGEGPGQLEEPWGAVSDNVGIYISDLELNRITRFSGEGDLLTSWSTNNNGKDNFDASLALARDSQGNVYVTDAEGHSVRVFSATGTLLAELGSNKNNDFELDQPSGIAIDAANSVYVINTDENQIKKFARI